MDSILTLSRIQFANTAAFHILFPMMSIGIAFYLFIMEAMWLYTGKESYYRQLRFWLKIFTLSFGFGVASGFPMAFQFGTNWSGFADSAGPFFGNIIGFETTVAFTLEATFLGILLFGWKRVPRWLHLLANFLVLFGASLSAFWILAANSWMQIPTGVHMEAGKVIVDDYFAALFNPDTLVTYAHKWLACIETSVFLIGGLAAWAIFKNRENEPKRAFFVETLKYMIVIALFVTPLQLWVGDTSGLTVNAYQREKLAALELHYDTNPEGVGAPLNLIAWPNKENTGNSFAIAVPNGLSYFLTHSKTGTVLGLNEFEADNKPTRMESIMVFYSFRVMVAIGIFLFALMLLALWFWKKGKLTAGEILRHPKFLYLWIFSIPMGFIAAEAGWMVREIGRQPWILYHMMRTSEGVSVGLNAIVVGAVLAAVVLLYLILLGLLAYFIRKTMLTGPDLESPVV